MIPETGREGQAPGMRFGTPWVSVLIWVGVFLALYALHDVFPIIFITFLLVYLVRAIVVPLAHHIRSGERRWLERWLTLAAFGMIVLVLWGVGSLLGTRFIQQGRLLIAHAESLQPQEVLENLLSRTVGAYLFGKTYGDPKDPRYQAGLARFTAEGRAGEGAFAAFGPLQAQVQAGFEMAYETAQRARLERQIKGKGGDGPAFDQWLSTLKAPALVAERRSAYLARLSAQAGSGPQATGADLEHRLDDLAVKDLVAQPAERAKLVAEWEQWQVDTQWRTLRASPEYRQAFARWFDSPEGRALDIPYGLDEYVALDDAYRQGASAFDRVFESWVSRSPEGRDMARLDFQRATEADLARHWWAASPTAASLREHLEKDASEVAAAATARIAAAVRSLIAVPTQIGLALMLTILISFDMTGLKQGVLRLRESRFAGIFAILAPNLVAVGRLIGRAFAAQGLIALFNALLTLAMLRLLGIENELLLGLTVFIASFIPVLGVILSAVPITLQALLQPDGSLGMALYALLGIGVIHAIEAMVLSPKIVGKVLHLHPVLVLAVLVIGEHLAGVWGLLLGVPIAVYAIHAGVFGEPIPGIYEPGRATDPAPVVK